MYFDAPLPGARVKVGIVKLHPDAIIPFPSKEGDVASDLKAIEDLVIPANGHKLVRTGLAIQLPRGWRAMVKSRSGLSLKHGIEAGAGVIDNGYRGELGVIIHNHHEDPFFVSKGDRIAQLTIEPYFLPIWDERETLDSTERGSNGWGSTGIKSAI